MFILGIDTATKVAGAAVLNNERLIAERFIHNQLTHSQNIIPIIDQVMADSDLKPEQLQGIAVTGGPGSFTGLRIGMALAKAMGLALNIPVLGISTLKALAWNVFRSEGLICPILDAKKKEVYTCIYKSQPQDLEEVIAPAAMSIGKLHEELSRFKGPVTFLGDAVPVFGDLLTEIFGQRAVFATKTNNYPRAAAVAELGLIKMQEGKLSDSTYLQPVYLRKSEAEVTWEAKHGHEDEGNF